MFYWNKTYVQKNAQILNSQIPKPDEFSSSGHTCVTSTQHKKQNIISTPQKRLLSYVPLANRNHYPDLSHYRSVLSVFDLYINGFLEVFLHLHFSSTLCLYNSSMVVCCALINILNCIAFNNIHSFHECSLVGTEMSLFQHIDQHEYSEESSKE